MKIEETFSVDGKVVKRTGENFLGYEVFIEGDASCHTLYFAEFDGDVKGRMTLIHEELTEKSFANYSLKNIK